MSNLEEHEAEQARITAEFEERELANGPEIKGFDKFACTGDSIEFKFEGFDVIAWIEHDWETNIDDDDSHNVDQNVTGCDDEQQKALLAARKAWIENEWFYGCLIVKLSVDDVELCRNALGGLEINYPNGSNAYLTDTAKELADEMLADARKNATRYVKALASVMT